MDVADYAVWQGASNEENNAMPDLLSIVLWVVIGSIAGKLASMVVKTRLSFAMSAIVGIIGAVVGGWLFSLAGITLYGIVGTLIAAFVGAIVVLAVAMWLLRK